MVNIPGRRSSSDSRVIENTNIQKKWKEKKIEENNSIYISISYEICWKKSLKYCNKVQLGMVFTHRVIFWTPSAALTREAPDWLFITCDKHNTIPLCGSGVVLKFYTWDKNPIETIRPKEGNISGTKLVLRVQLTLMYLQRGRATWSCYS